MKKYSYLFLLIPIFLLSFAEKIFSQDSLSNSNLSDSISNYIYIFTTFLSVVIAAFIFREAYLMRKINTQPDLVYYIKDLDFVSGLLKNIGKGTAYNVKLELISSSTDSFELLEQMEFAFPHMAPNQQVILNLGHLNIQGEPLGFSIHDAKISWEDKENRIYKAKFTITSELIRYVEKDPHHSISKELKGLASKFRNRNLRL